ncbi:carbonate dehydratase [Myxococcota bacterium]|nr:carbonate dehydratase [Myxococcota bacterium]
MATPEQLLAHNRAWAARMEREDPQFFKRLSELQRPEFLWIGCSDSRVPANQITGTMPGEVFVHRNVANLVVHTDLNLLTVVEYAVEVLGVQHIIVCGHYGCGGIRAAMTQTDFGLINTWLRNIKDVYRFHREELDAIADEDLRARRLVELNVLEQVDNLAKTTCIQSAWKKYRRPELHGWVYGLDDGLIKALGDVPVASVIDPLYQLDGPR